MGFSTKHCWNYKCPRCRQGEIFTKPMSLTDPIKMPERCDQCNQKIEPEPGFYFGAMFLSYIFSGWYLLLPTLLLVFYFDWSVSSAMAFTIFLGLISYCKIVRASRSLWLHLMVKHDPLIEQEVLSKINQNKTDSTVWTPS